MAKTLARRLGRVGLLPSSYTDDGQRILNYDPEITDKGRSFIESGIRAEHRSARLKMRQDRKKHGVSQTETKVKQAANETKSKPKK